MGYFVVQLTPIIGAFLAHAVLDRTPGPSR